MWRHSSCQKRKLLLGLILGTQISSFSIFASLCWIFEKVSNLVSEFCPYSPILTVRRSNAKYTSSNVPSVTLSLRNTLLRNINTIAISLDDKKLRGYTYAYAHMATYAHGNISKALWRHHDVMAFSQNGDFTPTHTILTNKFEVVYLQLKLFAALIWYYRARYTVRHWLPLLTGCIRAS